MTDKPRLALIGPRRSKQGLGPFLAKFFARAGCEVPAIVGHRPETLEGGEREMRERAGLEVEGFTSLAAAHIRHRLHGAVIASPPATHAGYLKEALELGLHVYCEKPFVTGVKDPMSTCEGIVQGCKERGLLLMENVQWPETWPSYLELFPEMIGRTPETFEMWLSPHEGGRPMIIDSYSHPISLLQAIVPGEGAHVEVISYTEPDARSLRCDFDWVTDAARVRATIHTRTQIEQPKPAAYGIDGKRADREVEPGTYAMTLRDAEGRSIPMPDPMERLVSRFAREVKTALRKGSGQPDPAIVPRQRIFEELLAAFG
ncbi:MAG: Gfo/Idh/MocA family oxidoreductase [Planctomycetota bacterium]